MAKTIERKFYLKQFKAISNAISTYEDINLLVNHLVEGVCRTFSVKGASIMLFDELEQQLFRVSSYGISDEYHNKGPVFVDQKYRSLDTGKVEIVSHMKTDKRIQYPEAAEKEGIVSMVAIPIKYRTNVLGEIRIYHSETLVLHNEDVESLCVLANQLGLAIENNGLKNFLEQIRMAIEALPPRMLKG